MEIGGLAATTAAQLVPYLPFLLKIGEGVAGETGKKLAGGTEELAQHLWAKLSPRLEGNSTALEVARDAAAPGDDAAAVAAFRRQLKKLLEDDPSLAAALADMLDEAEPSGRSVVVPGDAIGSPITHGEGNTVSVGNVGVSNRRESEA